MNILTDDIEQVAESIKLRMIARGGNWAVYVGKTGRVKTERVGDDRLKSPPDSDMMGTYNRKATVSDIEDDLVCRMRELRKDRKDRMPLPPSFLEQCSINRINVGPPYVVNEIGPYRFQVCDALGVVAVSGPGGGVFCDSRELADQLCAAANEGYISKE